MEQLLKTWKLRMVKYRQEADNANTPITRVKAMNKFFILRDCIKELEEQLIIPAVSNSLLEIELKGWEHTCGDGCCYTDGMDIFLNGEQLDEQNAEDSVNALTAILNKLGYNFEINCY